VVALGYFDIVDRELEHWAGCRPGSMYRLMSDHSGMVVVDGEAELFLRRTSLWLRVGRLDQNIGVELIRHPALLVRASPGSVLGKGKFLSHLHRVTDTFVGVKWRFNGAILLGLFT
jgi:hypothetical protein